MRFADEQLIDADRSAIAAWLTQNRLHLERDDYGTHYFIGPDDRPLAFDGRVADIFLDPLDQVAPITGGVRHATLSPQECSFIFDLCFVGRMLLMNHQGTPAFVVPARTHLPAQIPEGMLEDTVWVETPDDLATALSGSVEQFQRYRDQIIRDATHASSHSESWRNAPPPA